MTAILKVDTIQDTAGNNIINESSDTITIGASGDTTNIVGTLQNNGSALNFATVNGITMAQQWRITADVTSDADPVTSNLEIVDTTGYGGIGSNMTQSSGVFTFPSTGIYKVEFVGMCSASGSDNVLIAINVTTNNSSYAEISRNFYGVGQSQVGTAYCNTLIDVTDTSNVKVSFKVGSLDSGSVVSGDSAKTLSGMMFTRLGDT